MSQKIMIGILSVLMVPFIQGCDERDVATGMAVGAVVGGTLVAVSTDRYDHNDYYRYRYNNYYRHRRDRYRHRYGHRYRHRYGDRRGSRYGHHRGDRGHRRWPRPGRGRFDRALVSPVAFTAPSAEVKKFADFYQMPVDSAQLIWSAKSRALHGDLQGLVEIGLFSKDFQNLVEMKKPSNDTLYRVSLRTGLDEDHVRDILTDMQQEIAASEKAGRINL